MGAIAQFEAERADKSARARTQLASTLAQMGNRISTGEQTAKTKRMLINLGVEPYLVQSMSPEDAGKMETQLRIAGMKSGGKGGNDIDILKLVGGERNTMSVLGIPYDKNKDRYDKLSKIWDEKLEKVMNRGNAPDGAPANVSASRLPDYKANAGDALKMAMGQAVDDPQLEPASDPFTSSVDMALPVSATPVSTPAPKDKAKKPGKNPFVKKGK